MAEPVVVVVVAVYATFATEVWEPPWLVDEFWTVHGPPLAVDAPV